MREQAAIDDQEMMPKRTKLWLTPFFANFLGLTLSGLTLSLTLSGAIVQPDFRRDQLCQFDCAESRINYVEPPI
jgi:hypothetical protein